MSLQFWLTAEADYMIENPIAGSNITSSVLYWRLTQDMSEHRSEAVLGVRASTAPAILVNDTVEIINNPPGTDTRAFSGKVSGIGSMKKGIVEYIVTGRDSALSTFRFPPSAPAAYSDEQLIQAVGEQLGFAPSSAPYYDYRLLPGQGHTWQSYLLSERSGLEVMHDFSGPSSSFTPGDYYRHALVEMKWDGQMVGNVPKNHVIGKAVLMRDNDVTESYYWPYEPGNSAIVGEPEYRDDHDNIITSVTVVGTGVSSTQEAGVAIYGRRARTYNLPWIITQYDAQAMAVRILSQLSGQIERVSVKIPRSSANEWPSKYMSWVRFWDGVNLTTRLGWIIRAEFDSRKPTIEYTIGYPSPVSSTSGMLSNMSAAIDNLKRGLDQSLKTTDVPVFAGATVGGVEIIGDTVDGVDVSEHTHDGTAIGGKKINLANVEVTADKNMNARSLSNCHIIHANAYRLHTAGVNRWIIEKQGTEAGSDSGSDMAILARTDDGGPKFTSVLIKRDTSEIGVRKTVYPIVDKDADLGKPANKFRDLYLSGDAKAATFNGIDLSAKAAQWDLASATRPPVPTKKSVQGTASRTAAWTGYISLTAGRQGFMPVSISSWVDSGGMVRVYAVYDDDTETQLSNYGTMEGILASCGNQSGKGCIKSIKVTVISDGVSGKTGGAELIGWEF